MFSVVPVITHFNVCQLFEKFATEPNDVPTPATNCVAAMLWFTPSETDTLMQLLSSTYLRYIACATPSPLLKTWGRVILTSTSVIDVLNTAGAKPTSVVNALPPMMP